MEKENKLWQFLPKLPDLQSAWLLLLFCAGPRFNYSSRTVAPQTNGNYAQGHDSGMWRTLCALLQKQDPELDLACPAATVATLPSRLGGLGLRSAVRSGPAAFWASWADTLPMMAARCPELADTILLELEKGFASESKSDRAVTAAKATLLVEGYKCPS